MSSPTSPTNRTSPTIPTYTKCMNPRDYITLEEFDEKSDIVFIWDGKLWHCYDRKSLYRYMNEPNVVMSKWIGSSDPLEGGGPSEDMNDWVIRMPDGYYINFASFNSLYFDQFRYYNKQMDQENVPLGNTGGNFTMSSLHGQSSYPIYHLFPMTASPHFTINDLENDIQTSQHELKDVVDDYVTHFLDENKVDMVEMIHTPKVRMTAEQRRAYLDMEDYILGLVDVWIIEHDIPDEFRFILRRRLQEEFCRLLILQLSSR